MLAPREVAAQWSTVNFIDEFGDSSGRGARSASVKSLRPMRSPYADTTGRIMVNCTRAWIRFSEAPNLTGGSTRDGYTVHSVTVRVDGKDAGRWDVFQTWGSEDLYFLDDRKVIAALSAGGTFAVSFPWFRGPAAFSWSLSGSSDLIRASCD